MPRVDLGDHEAHVVGGHPYVAGGGQHHASAHAVPVYGADRYGLHGRDRLRHQAPGIGAGAVRPAAARERGEIRARGEGPAVAPHDMRGKR